MPRDQKVARQSGRVCSGVGASLGLSMIRAGGARVRAAPQRIMQMGEGCAATGLSTAGRARPEKGGQWAARQRCRAGCG